MPDLAVTLGRLNMRNPLLLASGTVGYGPEYLGLVDFEAVGAVVTKTVTLEPRPGNRPPRLAETPSGLLNAIGLENVGLRAFLEEKLPEAAELPAPIVASVAGATPAEFAELAREIASRQEVSALEMNISCPNVERPRRPLWADPEGVADVVAAARRETDKTLTVKLSPNAADVLSVAEAAERAGADGLVVANTMPGMRIDLARRAPALGNETGGLSGRALLPINLALVWHVAAAVSIPVVASGGISSAEGALEYMMAGATAFQVGTALFADPGAPVSIMTGLIEHMRQDGIETITEYVGLAREETRKCRETIVQD